MAPLSDYGGQEPRLADGVFVTPQSRIPPRSLVLGASAKVIRPVREHEARMGIEGAARYVELAQWYLTEGTA